MMSMRSCAVCVVVLSVVLGAVVDGSPVDVAVTVGERMHDVLPNYVSADLDWWHGTDASGGSWGNASILYIDLEDPLLNAAASGIDGGFLRIGGSEDNIVKYLVGGMTEAECNAPVVFRGHNVSHCLTMERWDAVAAFASRNNKQIVFGVSFFTGPDGWDSTNNVADFLAYTAKKNYPLYGIELGEEMAPSSDSDFKTLVDAYVKLAGMVRTLWAGSSRPRPLVMGPCDGMSNETPGSSGFKWMQRFLATVLPLNVIDVVVMHSYNNDGGNNWAKPGFLDQTLVQAKAMLNESRSHNATIQLWCGECGPHNGGGLANVTDRVISSFWYVDALGQLAQVGLSEFGRQALVGSHYGLLQETTHIPNPDFYVAALWSKLMGTQVLATAVSASAADDLHVYAHRASDGKSTTVAFSAISSSVSAFNVTIAGLAPSTATSRYVFTVPDAGVLSQVPLLNGKPLSPPSGSTLPPLIPITQQGASTSFVIPGMSYGFVQFHHDGLSPADQVGESPMDGALFDIESTFHESMERAVRTVLDAVQIRSDGYSPTNAHQIDVDNCPSPSKYFTPALDKLGGLLASKILGDVSSSTSSIGMGNAVGSALAQSIFETGLNSLLLGGGVFNPTTGGMGFGFGFSVLCVASDGTATDVFGYGSGSGGGGATDNFLSTTEGVKQTSGYGGGGGGGLSGSTSTQIGGGASCNCGAYIICTCDPEADGPASVPFSQMASAVASATSSCNEVYVCGQGGGGMGLTVTVNGSPTCQWGGGFASTFQFQAAGQEEGWESALSTPAAAAKASSVCASTAGSGPTATGTAARTCTAQCRSQAAGFNACFCPCFQSALQSAGVMWANTLSCP